MLKCDIILYMDCIRKTVFDAKLYLHIIKIEKQKIEELFLKKHLEYLSIKKEKMKHLENYQKHMIIWQE